MKKGLILVMMLAFCSGAFASWEGGFEHDHSKDDPYAPKILDKLLATETSVLKIPALFAVRTYQNITWSKQSTATCNFYPSCSRYGFMAVKKYGGLKGTIMAGDRYIRCNPWAGQANYHVDYERGLLLDPIEKNSVMNWFFDLLNF